MGRQPTISANATAAEGRGAKALWTQEACELAAGILAGAGGGSLIFAASVPDFLPVTRQADTDQPVAGTWMGPGKVSTGPVNLSGRYWQQTPVPPV